MARNLTCACFEQFEDGSIIHCNSKAEHKINSTHCQVDAQFGACEADRFYDVNSEDVRIGLLSTKYMCRANVQANPLECRWHTPHSWSKCCTISDEEEMQVYPKCNRTGAFVFEDDETEDEAPPLPIMAILIGVIIVIVIIIISRKAYSYWRQKDEHVSESTEVDPLVDQPRTVSTTIDTGMSSGRGPQLLVPRRIALEVELTRVIGQGRFGRVNLGIWNGQEVACKIFDSKDEDSWKRETNAYDIKGITHKYILNRISSDMRDSGVAHEYWLITDYHSNGSLFEYLKMHTLTVMEALTLQHTAIDGLNHLHTYIQGTVSKIQVAHRDIKTKNILVNDHGESIIADLGLAVSFNPATDKIDLPRLDGLSSTNGIQVGTKRYMPPEILEYNARTSDENAFNPKDFKSFINADTYSLGLVLWEIASRTIVDDISPLDYRVPFESECKCDPTLAEITRIVCHDKIRPVLAAHIATNGQMGEVARLIKECLADQPEARLNTLRLRKTLVDLKQTLRKENSTTSTT